MHFDGTQAYASCLFRVHFHVSSDADCKAYVRVSRLTSVPHGNCTHKLALLQMLTELATLAQSSYAANSSYASGANRQAPQVTSILAWPIALVSQHRKNCKTSSLVVEQTVSMITPVSLHKQTQHVPSGDLRDQEINGHRQYPEHSSCV